MDENTNNNLSEIDILKAQISDLDNNWKRALADIKIWLIELTKKRKNSMNLQMPVC